MNNYSIFAVSVITFFAVSCGKHQVHGSNNGAQNSGCSDKTNEISKVSSSDEIKELIKSADAENSESAYKLYEIYTYSERDYGIAYFWAVKAHELGSPKATKELVISAEN